MHKNRIVIHRPCQGGRSNKNRKAEGGEGDEKKKVVLFFRLPLLLLIFLCASFQYLALAAQNPVTLCSGSECGGNGGHYCDRYGHFDWLPGRPVGRSYDPLPFSCFISTVRVWFSFFFLSRSLPSLSILSVSVERPWCTIVFFSEGGSWSKPGKTRYSAGSSIDVTQRYPRKERSA